MKLSVNIVLDELMLRYPNAELNQNEAWFNDLVLLPPLFHEGEAFERHRVYVINSSHLPAQPKIEKNCLIISGQLSVKYNRPPRFLVITLNQRLGMVKLYNAVLQIFEKYAAWDDGLRNLLLKQAPLTDYLAHSFPIIKNPLRILDNDCRYLARFKEGIIRKEYEYSNDQEYLIPELMKEYDEDTANALAGSRELIPVANAVISGGALALNLFEGAARAAVLYVHDNNRPFRMRDPALIKYLGRYLEAALVHCTLKGETGSLLRKTMMNIINGRVYSAGEIRQLKSTLPVIARKGQQFVCLAAMDMTPGFTPQHSAWWIEIDLPSATAVPVEEAIAVLVAANSTCINNGFLKKIETTTGKLNIKAGCSDVFENFFELKEFFLEAVMALRLGMAAHSDQHIYHFRDYAFQYFLQSGCGILPARLMVAGCVRRLAERDKGAAVSYCESLRVYLSTGRNTSESARLLGIQRNTFIARLERIQKLIDLDLDDPEERLYVEISLLLLEK
ncbi:MAG: helix-turn-helix domain-containing protein [Syntrophomonadaceae bacterium]|jgi:hypothetical protein|nr:helix-turn-helix domain-containing protein [Syntrophomonadaceae bacterium]